MGGDLVLGGEDTPLPPNGDGTDMVGRRRAARPRRGAAARDLHARLRVDELRRRRRLRDGRTRPSMLRAMARGIQRARRAARARGLRHRATSCMVNELIARRPDRRPAPDPALHRHPVRRARRLRDAARDGQPAAAGRRVLGLLDRPHAAPVRRAGAARRRQRPRRPRGQHLPLARPARDERPSSSSAPSPSSRR